MTDIEEQTEKHCWVCLATEKDDFGAEWVSPCRCKGCTKWIHQECLQRWLDEKQRGNSGNVVCCPQCGTQYHIVFPKMGPLVCLLQRVDGAMSRVSPFAAVGVLMGTAYWSAVTYGAVTVLQVVGHKKGLSAMEAADPLFLLMGLPSIPVLLLLGRMIRWEDYLLRIWQRYCATCATGRSCPRVSVDGTVSGEHVSVSRTLCGALVFPTVSSLFGKVFFSRVSSDLQRTLLGGIAFVLIKGALKIYFKQQQHIVQVNRYILDRPEPGASARDEDTGDAEDSGDTEDTEDSGNE